MKVVQCLIFIILITSSLIAMEHVPEAFKNLPKGVQSYIEMLPKIKVEDDACPAAKTKVITDYLLGFGDYSIDVEGRKALEQKIFDCIKDGTPICRCMPGFPVASGKIPFNDQHCFNMGDLVGLLTRNHISCEISKVHKPGSSVSIYWEPFIYDMNRVCQEQLGHPQFAPERIAFYQNTLKTMISHLEPCVKIGTPNPEAITELYRKNYADIAIPIDQQKLKYYEAFLREDLDSDLWIDRAECIRFNQEKAALESKYPQIKDKSFSTLKSEPIFNKKIKSNLGARKHLNTVASALAKTVFIGSQKMALLMEKEIPDFHKQIRESVRADKMSVQKKLGTPIIYGSTGTPWHKVLVIESDSVKLVPYKELAKAKPALSYYVIGNLELGYIDKQK